MLYEKKKKKKEEKEGSWMYCIIVEKKDVVSAACIDEGTARDGTLFLLSKGDCCKGGKENRCRNGGVKLQC